MRCIRIAVLVGLLGPVPAQSASSVERTVAQNLVALASPVSCSRFEEVAAWAGQHGYRLPRGEGVCRRGPDSPAVALGWNTAAVWANALSEMSGLAPAYRDAAGAVARDAITLGIVPAADLHMVGYRLPTLAELGLPRVRAMMTRDIQEWSATRIDLGDGKPYYYLCKPGACDFHSSGMSGHGVSFRLVRTGTPHG